jgi:ubiquinone/menaquinone biosynthesis C-methylase UbiE
MALAQSLACDGYLTDVAADDGATATAERDVGEQQEDDAPMTKGFYDALAPFYHLLYPDWEASSRRQSHALVALFREFGIPPGGRILDAACGIGTQALGLAAAGYAVSASDVSTGALERLRREADARGLSIPARVADLRALTGVFDANFHAVVACDNAIPHLLTDADISRAFAECRRCLEPGGVLVVSVRDYAAIERRTPDVRPYGSHTVDGRQYSAEQVWEWDREWYDLTLRVIEEAPSEGRRVHEFHTRYYAVSIERLIELLAAAGFSRVERRDGAFFQPLIIGMAA